jgi:hypothetical protein
MTVPALAEAGLTHANMVYPDAAKPGVKTAWNLAAAAAVEALTPAVRTSAAPSHFNAVSDTSK